MGQYGTACQYPDAIKNIFRHFSVAFKVAPIILDAFLKSDGSFFQSIYRHKIQTHWSWGKFLI